MYEWTDKIVLVTGGANGIGAEIVRIVLKEGAKYIALLDIDEDQGKANQDDLNKKSGKPTVHFYKCDVSEEDQIDAVFKAIVEECGYIDVVVNNAGVCNETLYRKEIEVNFTGVVSFSLKALKLMRKDEGGRGGAIISIASIAALTVLAPITVYSGTKAAILQFNLCLGMDDYYKRTEVRTITLCFGRTDTEIINKTKSFDKLMDEQITGILAAFPMQSAEIAARGVSEAYKKGGSASTWVVDSGMIKDVTDAVSRAYRILTEAF